MNVTNSKFIIIILNCIPILGVVFYSWAPFEMFWLFWVETLIIALFNAIRIFFAQNHPKDQPFNSTEKKYNKLMSLKYMVARIGIFLFYSIFIITFIGFIGSKGRYLEMLGIIFFQDILFNLAIALIVVSQTFYLIKFYFINKAYFYDNPKQYNAIFDGRQIVIHIAIVIGSFGVAFFFKGDENVGYGAIWMISILCLLKIFYEIYTLRSTIPNT
ncbi:MAG: DUF6498-containing protein [Ferruginibacter sp.]